MKLVHMRIFLAAFVVVVIAAALAVAEDIDIISESDEPQFDIPYIEPPSIDPPGKIKPEHDEPELPEQTPPLSSADIADLVRSFSDRSLAVRESAIRQLLNRPAENPSEARAAVVAEFRRGDLSARLTALELLQEWKAPLGELDPWKTDTLTEPRLAALDKWAKEAAGDGVKEPTAEKLAEAGRQIDRMLDAKDDEADAIAERLTRLGEHLLPEIYERLAKAETDRQRQLLLTLRYRLLASDEVLVKWADGLKRLADVDPRARQQAAGELVEMASHDDLDLLSELFADPDPLVREISLRGLQELGGKDAVEALVKLLSDPELNVRAAVLKQLAENPSRAMVPKVIEYLKTEKDGDLIVHAIRFLRAAESNSQVVKCLMTLLKHESWQVRAEAAEGVSNSINSSLETGLRADAYVALMNLLDDPDAFVVSRALEGLQRANMAEAVEPLVKAAEKNPELASQIIGILASGDEMRLKAMPHLKRFRKHEKPEIRAAAITGLMQVDGAESVAEELKEALSDEHVKVRLAAAVGLFQILEGRRGEAVRSIRERRQGAALGYEAGPGALPIAPPESMTKKAIRFLFGSSAKKEEAGEETPVAAEGDDSVDEPATVEAGEGEAAEGEPAKGEADEKEPAEEEEVSPWDKWLIAHGKGEGWPEWFSESIEPLRKMLASDEIEEKMVAAAILVALGKVDEGLPVLKKHVKSNPEHRQYAIAVLPWLLVERRLEYFEYLRQNVEDEQAAAMAITALIQVPEPAVADVLWDLTGDEKLTPRMAEVLRSGLLRAYFGDDYYNVSRAIPAVKKRAVEAAKPRVQSGPELQRLVAMTFLAQVDAPTAGILAADLVDDETQSDELRCDAFQVVLLTGVEKEAVAAAVEAMSDENEERRKMAIRFLVNGADSVRYFRDSFSVYVDGESYDPFGSYSSGTPIIPEPPRGLKADDVLSLVKDEDPDIAAQAGYLLSMFGKDDGMDALVAYWKKHKEDDRAKMLMYRAISSLDDSSRVDILKEIYPTLDQWDVRQFYWTIRIMSGPEILKFRKEIRDKVGMDNLR